MYADTAKRQEGHPSGSTPRGPLELPTLLDWTGDVITIRTPLSGRSAWKAAGSRPTVTSPGSALTQLAPYPRERIR